MPACTTLIAERIEIITESERVSRYLHRLRCLCICLPDKNNYHRRGKLISVGFGRHGINVMKLDNIYKPIADDLIGVREILNDSLAKMARNAGATKQDEFIKRAINHLFMVSGKNLRPALVLFAARSIANISDELKPAIQQLAAVVELIHSASLIHDDVIDESDHRRKLISVHRKFGIKNAILIGDILYAHAFAILTDLCAVEDRVKLKLFDIFSELTKKMCYGEIFEQQVIKIP